MTAWSGSPGKTRAACFKTLTTPACEHAENTTSPLSLTFTARKRSSMIKGSGSHLPVVGTGHVTGEPGLVGRDAGDLATHVEAPALDELLLGRAHHRRAVAGRVSSGPGISLYGTSWPSGRLDARARNMPG